MNDGGPAFPAMWQEKDSLTGEYQFVAVPGMPLRDYFAAMALNGLLAEGGGFTKPEQGAQAAYALADAMIKEREHEGGNYEWWIEEENRDE